ncbi:DEAD/DEAH box helicase, partial [Clostridium botulinum]|nr:DEAD/DEAH box helicase [Clostridium botulinum]
KLDLVKELQDLRYSDEEYVSHRNELLKDLIEDVNNLNEDNFIVKMNLKYVQKYKNKDEWQSLGAINTKDIKEHISPLISKLKDDEFAKRFDILMYTIECSNLQGNSATRPIKSVIETAENLSKLGTIPQIQEQKYIIDKVRETEFWEDVDLFELDEVRSALRELLKYLEKATQTTYY